MKWRKNTSISNNIISRRDFLGGAAAALWLTSCTPVSHYTSSEKSPYYFNGPMPRRVLEKYLSRAVTHAGLCSSYKDPTTPFLNDDIRMLVNIGAKFAGRTGLIWLTPRSDEEHFKVAERNAAKVHKADPEMILQAAIFEIVEKKINRWKVPAWVFEEFALEPEERNFRYEDMLSKNGKYHNHWGKDASVPDMTRLETQMWFYYRARRYIDSGFEAIHFGQIRLIGMNDKGYKEWRKVLGRIRKYARQNARRHWLLCDAHVPSSGIVYEDGKLLFDFHSFPLRLKEVAGQPQKCILEMGFLDAIYGRSKGGITPSGWRCESLPFLVEFDNWHSSGKGGQSIGPGWGWGYDEMSWFARQSKSYRNDWLRYAWNWVREHDKNGYVQFATRRILCDPIGDIEMYQANTKSSACPHGFGQEDTIKAIWTNNSVK